MLTLQSMPLPLGLFPQLAARRILFLPASSWIPVAVSLVIILAGCQSEMARWEFIEAKKAWEQEQDAEALDQMRDAVARSDEHWELALPLAIELAKRGEREAVALCDRVLGQPAVQQSEGLLEHTLRIKVECLSFLGDFSNALSTLKKLYEKRVDRSAREENELAYHRALAGQDLELAYLNITKAIQSVASDWCCGERLEFRDKAIVASALLARYFYGEAQREVSFEPLAVAKERLISTLTHLNVSIETIENQYDTYIECESGELSQVNLNRCTARSNLVVLLIVRAMVRQDLGDKAGSNRDRFRANRMASHLEKVIQNLPSNHDCINLLSISFPLLDTRGYIRSQLPWSKRDSPIHSNYAEALADLDIAILACQTDQRAFRSSLSNNLNVSVAQVNQREKLLKRSEAVLRYHRHTMHLRGGNEAAAEADRLAIEQLGFTNYQQLF